VLSDPIMVQYIRRVVQNATTHNKITQMMGTGKDNTWN
jgi:hypothetical protein